MKRITDDEQYKKMRKYYRSYRRRHPQKEVEGALESTKSYFTKQLMKKHHCKRKLPTELEKDIERYLYEIRADPDAEPDCFTEGSEKTLFRLDGDIGKTKKRKITPRVKRR